MTVEEAIWITVGLLALCIAAIAHKIWPLIRRRN